MCQTGFPPVPRNSKFVRVLNIAESHWIVVSNINAPTTSTQSVCVYDSGFYRISHTTKKAICQLVQCSADTLLFDVMNIQRQPNSHLYLNKHVTTAGCQFYVDLFHDCGLFALACATELVHQRDPTVCSWDVPNMRKYLLHAFEAGKIDGFPCVKNRRVALGMRVRKSIIESIYCYCRMPNDKSRPMIRCDKCLKWFHKDCAELDLEESYQDFDWSCNNCKNLLKLAV